MRRSVFVLSLFFIVLGLSGCARTPVKPVNAPEVQRDHAREAQDEMSSGVRR